MARARGWSIVVLVVVLLFALNGRVERLADALLHAPWAYGWDPRGDLTDDWTGAVSNGRALDLSLAREFGEDGLPVPADDADATLVGAGRLCAAGRATLQFGVTGRSNRSGSRLRLSLQHPAGTISGLNGRWTGDAIELSGDLFSETAAISLRRGRACAGDPR
ncbi:MAG TPA: hypothetical protein VMW48_16115 [Vicinamibacterales bacterium]|nr:hypothetical protein [Vicinamibacterales bacterium]